MRWRKANGSVVSAYEFIGAAETRGCGLCAQLGGDECQGYGFAVPRSAQDVMARLEDIEGADKVWPFVEYGTNTSHEGELVSFPRPAQ
jgi:EAL domain-containing protein (putative c-di-GMP-specific phosphodiesterase class I)